MNRHYLTLTVGTVVLVFLQVVILNHLRIFDYFMPILYLYPLLKMPLQSERWVLILFGATVGLLMDLLMNTPGLNIASTTLAVYVRYPLLSALIPDEVLDEEDGPIVPSPRVMKLVPYLLYLLILTFIHVFTLMGLEAFSMGLFALLVPYVLGSTVFSVVLYLVFDLFSYKKKRE